MPRTKRPGTTLVLSGLGLVPGIWLIVLGEVRPGLVFILYALTTFLVRTYGSIWRHSIEGRTHPYLIGGIIWTTIGVGAAVLSVALLIVGVSESDRGTSMMFGLAVLTAPIALFLGIATLRAWSQREKPDDKEQATTPSPSS